jgi:single-strand DNA-binding protein
VSSLNKIILIGHIRGAVDARVTQSGEAVTKFTLEVDRAERTDGLPSGSDNVPVVAWRQLAERQDLFHEGTLLMVEGRVSARSYDDNTGKRHWVTEVEARDIRALGSPTATQQTASHSSKKLEEIKTDDVFAKFEFDEDPFSGKASSADLEDEIPF